MAREELATVDSALEALKSKRNLILGGTAVAGLAVVLVLFVQNQMAESKMRPWKALLGDVPPWSAEPGELEAVAREVEGSAAEPLAIYWDAVRRYQNDDKAGMAQKLSELRERFPEHYLVERSLPSPADPNPNSENGDSPVLQRIARQVARLDQWGAQHPAPTTNQAPKPNNTLTLVTSEGSVVFGLYVDRAPESCQALVGIVQKYKGRYITSASADQWIEIGQALDGQIFEIEELDDAFPPFEANGLYHFTGAVSFKQFPFTGGIRHGELKIWLGNDFSQDGRSTVFATVVEGIEVLVKISNMEFSADRALQLANPIEITDVVVNAPDLPEMPAEEAPDDAEGDGENAAGEELEQKGDGDGDE